MVLISKQLFISLSTAQTLWNVETPFWAKFLKLKSCELITRNGLALIETLLFGDNSFNQHDNSRILGATIAL